MEPERSSHELRCSAGLDLVGVELPSLQCHSRYRSPLINVSTRAAVQSKQHRSTQSTPSVSSSPHECTDKAQSLVDTLQSVYNDEGIAGLYSGLGSSMLGVAATNGVYYAACEPVELVASSL